MKPNDPLYTVTQLGAELGITVRTLHFYEAQGLITPRRAGSTRVYTVRDHARMILILRGKRMGFSIKEIREYLDLYDIDPTQHTQTQVLLQKVQARIGKLREQRVALEQMLTELLDVERQAVAALQAMEGMVPPVAEQPKTKQKRAARAVPAQNSTGRLP